MTFRDVRMRGFRARAAVADVLAWVDSRPAPLGAEDVSLLGAAGRVLAEAVVAGADLPPFARASMDGWAVRGASTFGATDIEPRPLRLVGDARPGRHSDVGVGDGDAVRIRTGAPMPEGADAVLPAEDGEERDGGVLARGEIPPGRHVGQPGEDVRAGTQVLAAGRRLRPQDVAILSSLGVTPVKAVRKPRVAVLVTGEEVLRAGTKPEGARIADANGPLLDALIRRDGGAPLQRGIFGDEDPRLETEIAEVPADVVLVTGASSVGPEDRVPSIVARRGEVVFHGLALRPASPTGVGVVAGRPVFLLPGNPVSALCAYDLFAGRLVRRLGGRPAALPYPTRRLPLARKVVSELGRTDYLRVRVVDGRVEPLTSRGAGVLSTAVRADGFVLVPADLEGWQEGALVEVHLYDPEA
jgi:molybdopterin molybdotransferase